MNILVTGGGGFIGSHLVEKLLSKDNKVVCVDNFVFNHKVCIKSFHDHNNFKLYEIDINNYDELNKIFKNEKFDFVYHLAANSDIKLGYSNFNVDLNNSFLSTYNILRCMIENSVKNLMFASTSAIYGKLNTFLNEDTGPLLPISNYGAAKLSSEAYISSFTECYDLRAWIVRFPNVVGWRLTHGVIYDFINKLNDNSSVLQILGDGKQEKPYLFVQDLLEAIELIIKKSNNNVNIFNVSPDNFSTVDYIANTLIKKMNIKDVNISYSGGKVGWVGDVSKFKYDTAKIRDLGWLPNYTSDQAIDFSIEKELEFQNQI